MSAAFLIWIIVADWNMIKIYLKFFLQSLPFLACAKHMYMTLPQWKRFSFLRLLLFMFLCFSNKYIIQNKLSKTAEIELEKVFSKKKGIFSISWIPKTTPSKFNLRKTRQKSNKSYKMRNCKKKSIDYHLSNRLAWSKNQEITLWFNVGIM